VLAQNELASMRLELARELATAVLASDADEQHRRRVAHLMLRVERALEQGDSTEAAFARRRQRIASEWGLTANGTQARRPGGQRITAGERPTNAAAPAVLGAAR
jgi:hypothetical protein